MRTPESPPKRRSWLRRTLAILALVALLIGIAFLVSPWPGALLVRSVFNKGGMEMRAGLEPFGPDGVHVIANEQYDAGAKDCVLDVYIPDGARAAGERLPVLVWVHGGGWLAGSKDDTPGYFKLLGSKGYVVIAINYSLAPGSTFPTPLHQINTALAYITANADRFHADMDRVFMAGDSAGAQLTAQTAAMTTNPAHAAQVGISPTLRPEQLRGLVLHCGLYDMVTYVERADEAGGFIGYGTRILPWAYTGKRKPDQELLRKISPMLHATPDFPPVFISGGNGDPLTAHQSRPMAARLKELGVEVTELFFPDDHEVALPHEYQFNLREPDATLALDMTLEFLAALAKDNNGETPGEDLTEESAQAL
jgi:acetyl esterase